MITLKVKSYNNEQQLTDSNGDNKYFRLFGILISCFFFYFIKTLCKYCLPPTATSRTLTPCSLAMNPKTLKTANPLRKLVPEFNALRTMQSCMEYTETLGRTYELYGC